MLECRCPEAFVEPVQEVALDEAEEKQKSSCCGGCCVM